jgi:hypothetical protein
MRKPKNEQKRTEVRDQPFATIAMPLERLRQCTAQETNAQAGKRSKKNRQNPVEGMQA